MVGDSDIGEIRVGRSDVTKARVCCTGPSYVAWPEDEGSVFPGNVGIHLAGYMVSVKGPQFGS
jgi:hypothetical protein